MRVTISQGEKMYTVKDVSKQFNISPHTLRFYANKNLFPNITRNKQNIRLFSDKDLEYVEMVLALRHTGMSLPSIKAYIDLCAIGDDSVMQRSEIIANELREAENKLTESIQQRDILRNKLAYYQEAIKKGEKSVIWGVNKQL